MKWYKSPTDESDSPEIGELMNEHNLKGYYFWKRNLDVMGAHFDIWNPGCNRFNKDWYFQLFHPWIKDPRTIIKILDFFQSRHQIYYWVEDRDIILYFPELEHRADKYTEQCLLNPEKAKKERPTNAGALHEACKLHAQEITIKEYLNTEEIVENREDKSKRKDSNLEGRVGSSSNSSSSGA